MIAPYVPKEKGTQQSSSRSTHQNLDKECQSLPKTAAVRTTLCAVSILVQMYAHILPNDERMGSASF
jgi:hypothetical protein